MTSRKNILKQIEIILRHLFVYPVLRLIFRNPVIDDFVDLRMIHKILILRDDGIGDMIVSTPVFRKLKESYPNLVIGVFASKRNYEIIKHNPFIDQIYFVDNAWNIPKTLKKIRAFSYDAVLNFVFNRTSSEGIVANIVAPNSIKVGQGPDKYHFYFNSLLKFERNKDHMIKILAKYVDNVFGTNYYQQDLSPEIYIDHKSIDKVNKFLEQNNLARRTDKAKSDIYALINFSAIDIVRRMSIEQTVAVINTIYETCKLKPILIYPPNEKNKMRIIISRVQNNYALIYPESGSATLLEIASLISGASYVVTCDTSIVHFASATKTPVFVLFTPTAALNHEWTPYGVKNKCLYAQKGSGVDSIPIKNIIDELISFNNEIRDEL